MTETDYSKDSQIYKLNEKFKKLGFHSNIKRNSVEFFLTRPVGGAPHICHRLRLEHPNRKDFNWLLDGTQLFINITKDTIEKAKIVNNTYYSLMAVFNTHDMIDPMQKPK